MPSTAKVTWFEITSNDPAASRAFYESLFGWSAQGDPDVYLMFPPADDGGIAGGIMPARGVPTYACFGVEVDDVDDAYRRALELGASSLVEPTDNPGGVRSAYVRDPDGSIFSMYRFTAPFGAPA
jgi:predicted enzyme related to lactoylglutathione lyase